MSKASDFIESVDWKKFGKTGIKRLDTAKLGKVSDDDLMDRIDLLDNPRRNPDNADADKQELKLLRKEMKRRGFTQPKD